MIVLHRFQHSIVWTGCSLGGKAAHFELHVKDVGKTVGLSGIERGTPVERPLSTDS